MDISLLSILRTVHWDISPDIARSYAKALKNAMILHLENDAEKKEGYFISKKGTSKINGNFQDKLYIGNIHRIEDHLYWTDEELADDDQIVNVVIIDGPVTRDGGACSYGTKDWRDQVLYANTIPQVVGHLFIINTPGGESACRNDYEYMINDCRKNNKPTVAFVDGMCCSSGINLSSRCDRTIVMNPKDIVGCIGSMAAFWGTPDGATDQEGSRYVEIVGTDSPEKNAEYRDASNGDYAKLQKEVDKDTEDFHQTVRDNRPLVTDDMLKGETFEAQEAIPALVDEIGDMTRAIQCVFDLADGKLTPAREVTNGTQQPAPANEPDPNNEPPATADPDEPEEPAPNEPGPDEPDNPNREKKQEEKQKQQNNMTEEEKKNAQAEQAGATQEQEKFPAQSEKNSENEKKPTDEDKELSNGEQEPANDDEHKPNEGEQKTQDGEEKPTEGEQKPTDADELSKIKDALHTAEGLVADRDKSIAEKDSLIANLQKQIDDKEKSNADALADKDKAIADKDAVIADKDKSIADKDALIAKLSKQVSDLQGEVKELAASPTPMNDGEGGIPKDNGTGSTSSGPVKSEIKPDMSPEEISEKLRKHDKEIAEKRRRR